MTKETTRTGASGAPAETRNQDVDNPTENQDHTQDKPMSARDRIMASIEERVDAERSSQIAKEMSEYAASMGKTPEQIEDETRRAEAREELENEGLEDRSPIENAEDKPASRRDELPPEYADDPLAEFIVMDEDNNVPMFVTKVDGQERYIPLEQARRQIQKQEAADVRLRNAAERQKALDAREAEVIRRETELAARLAAQTSPPPEPPAPDVSDQDLLTEAQQFVENMFNNSPDDATASLAQLLGNMRRLQAKPAVQVDPQELARTTAELVRAQEREEAKTKDVKEGLKKFSDDYPEIMANKALFLYADDMTDSIALEWESEGRSFKDSEVLLEAGKRTMEWYDETRGKKPAPPPTPTPPTNNDRHARKRQLRPMPKPRSQALQQHAEEEVEQTPHDYVTEMRRSRGQGV